MKQTPLQEILKHKIALEGALTVAEYMDFCLYHPKYGYYTTRNPLGKEGDFITAPEISPLFGQTLAIWLVKQWEMLGSPKHFTLLEAGPGRGVLMQDILNTLKKISPNCLKTAQIYLLEISPNLRDIQKNTLKNNAITWINTLADAPFEQPVIFIANELLDAFPIRQFERKKGLWFEQKITFKKNKLIFTLEETDETDHLNRYRRQKKSYEPNIYKDEFIETHEATNAFLHELKQCMRKGIALFIDYGNVGCNTLQAVKSHTFAHPLETPGICDLTAHVDFEEVRNILGRTHCLGPQDMGLFLMDHGFATRATQAYEAETDPQKKEHLMTASQRLIDPNDMGSIFKVLTYIEM